MYANGPICAQKPPRFFRMYRREHRDQLSEVDSRCADAARGSVPGLVFAAGGGAGHPEWLPESAGSGAIRHPPPQRAHSGFGP